MRLMKILPVLAAAAALVLASAAPADAQVRVGIGGGPSFPVGHFGDHVDTGFHVQGDVTLGFPLLPIGVRADAAFNRFSHGDHDDDVIAGTVNAVMNFGLALVRGYALAGLGLYQLREDDDRETNIGINIGAGADVWLGPVRPFAEIRYHHAFSDVEDIQYFPITFGLRF